MSMDPRVLSQLLRAQVLGTSSWWNSDSLSNSSTQSDGNLFTNLLQSILGGSSATSDYSSYGMSSSAYGTTGWGDTIPAEYATYTLGANNLLSGFSSGSMTTGFQQLSNSSAYSGVTASTALARLSAAAGYGLSGTNAYDPIIADAAARFNVPTSLVKAVIDQESSFQPYAVSRAGAKGLMQLMDATARGLGVTDSFDAEQNIHGGTRFLGDLLRRYGGDEAMALAAYNAGPGRLEQLGITNRSELTAKYRSLPQETQAYVTRVLGKKSLYEA
ncbi:lytic transglycosylase domain-containing protein [Gorillibacterium sp. CAU 1737]|uniref:lytic transglycosylase domain-containing protein n=1 Tax=Gorillibacterium sp. CAU 1737 TaxID=3140362 RepID=UPI003261A3C3